MAIYKLYIRDKEGKERFVGTLQEKRKKRERITDESLINLSKGVLGEKVEIESDNVRLVQVGCIEDDRNEKKKRW